METWADFWTKYLEFAWPWLVGLVVLFFVGSLLVRRALKSALILLIGAFSTVIVYFMHHYVSLGLAFEHALGISIAAAVLVGAVLYYVVFVRS